MSFGNFDFAQGTDFERGIMKYLWRLHSLNRDNFCKPDIYDCKNDIFYETKYTRPYFDKDPAKFTDATDSGTGLPSKQFNRYQMIINNGHSRVIFIHGLDSGQYENKIFLTELTKELAEKRIYSPNKKTVFWKYSDLEILEGVSVTDVLHLIAEPNAAIFLPEYVTDTTNDEPPFPYTY